MRLVPTLTALGLATLLAGCQTEAPTRQPAAATPAPPSAAPEPTPATPEPPAADPAADPAAHGSNGPAPTRPGPTQSVVQPFVVHEWGTYTSVQGSDGASLEGMHHEEEQLPAFVHRRAVVPQGMKGLEILPEGVTQKLETPVLYFYSDRARAVTVDVGFPQGVVSEWYPQAASTAPAVGALTGVRDGHARWEIELDATLADADLPAVDEDDVWAPSRRVAAMALRAGEERERFIFYRGLGRFEMPFRVTSQAGSPALTVRNDGAEDVPAVFLLRVDGPTGVIESLGPLAAGESRVVVPTPKEHPLDLYSAEARALVAEALEDTGLFEDEALAMVDTWFHSYFRTPGLRVLYVAPRAWTDALLPLTVSPGPDELVRTLIGRVEVLTADDEAALVAQVQAAASGSANLSPTALGRFAEPRLRRAQALLAARGEAAAAQHCDGLIFALNQP